MRLVVLCDFDGTITSVDTGAIILSTFAKGNWLTYEEQYERNETQLEDVMQHQFAMVKTTKRSMIEAIEKVVHFRPGFEKLLKLCGHERIPLVIVSYGLDFCIRHMLNTASLGEEVRVHVPKARVSSSGISFSFPRLLFKDSVNLKDDMVRRYRQRGCEVVYIGDGTSDFPALKNADLRFAVRDSKVATLCRRDGVQFFEMTDFRPVINWINSRLGDTQRM